MESLGLDSENIGKVELKCNDNKEFTIDGNVISVDKLNAVTCTKIMEPLIQVNIFQSV